MDEELAEDRLKLGLHLAKVGDIDGAISMFLAAIYYAPEYDCAYFNLGVMYGLKNDYESAITFYDNAIRLYPRDYEYRFNRAHAYDNVGKSDLAIQEYLEALKLDAFRKEINYNIGTIYAKLKQYDQAILHFNDELLIYPNDIDTLLQRAICYFNIKKYNDSFDDIFTIMDLNRKVPEAYYIQAKLFVQKGYKAQAIKCIKEAIRLDPNNRQYRNYLVEIVFNNFQS